MTIRTTNITAYRLHAEIHVHRSVHYPIESANANMCRCEGKRAALVKRVCIMCSDENAGKSFSMFSHTIRCRDSIHPISFVARAIKNAATMCKLHDRRESIDTTCRQRIDRPSESIPLISTDVAVHIRLSNARTIKIPTQFEQFGMMFAYFVHVARDRRTFHVSIELNLGKSF